jgi:hypothetical protein
MKKFLFCLSLALFASTQLFSQTTFTGSNSDDWADAGNWDNGLPAAGNDATIPVGLIVVNFGYLFVDFTIDNYGSIYNDGVIDNYGTIYNDGTISNYGYIGIANNGAIINDIYGTITNNVDGEIYNNGGTITISWFITNDGLISNDGTINNDGTIFNNETIANFGAIANFGTIDNKPGGVIINEGSIDNYSTIDNFGNIDNFQTITNFETIYNCFGVYFGDPPGPNPLEETNCPSPEVCDGVDNDGNGEIDEGCGCTNVLACNFDPSSVIDDGSCILPDGCTNSTACNYYPAAVCDDGSCTLPDGCTNSTACNYYPAAVCDDGSCTLPDGCTSSTACNYNPAAVCDDGSCNEPSCADPIAVNYDSTADCDDSSCYYCGVDIASYAPIHFLSAYNADQFTTVAQVFTSDSDHNSVIVGVSIESCKLNGPTDMILELAPFNGSPEWDNPIASALVLEPEIPAMGAGCSVANFQYVYVTFENVNLQAGMQYAIVMKGNSYSSIRWQRSATPIDPTNPYSGGNIWEYNSDYMDEYEDPNHDLGFSVCEYLTSLVPGCMDSSACNYDSSATMDDGSCIMPDGCNDDEACNYNAMALCDDGSCEYLTCSGCTGQMACNYDSSATIDDESCDYTSCGGCMSAVACNYNPSATIEDGTCEYTSCAGCTYALAPEYDSSATLDDGSCTLSPSSGCQSDLNGDLFIDTQDLLLFLGAFGGTCD